MNKAAIIAIQMKLPVLLWGPPGVGKTSWLKQVAKSLHLQFEGIIASIREPSDFGGLPVITDGGVVLESPAWAKRLAEVKTSLNEWQDSRLALKALGDPVQAMLLIDEISTAPPAVQAALLTVILDNIVGDTRLPNSVAVVAAANPPEQAAGGWDLAPPMANRFIHLDVGINAFDWADAFMAGFPAPQVEALPINWHTGIAEQRALVGSFIKARPELVLRVPESESDAGRAWPSPRTLDMSASVLAAVKAVGGDDELRNELIRGCIGTAGMELLAYVDNLDLPDPEELLENPKSFKYPEEGDKQYAILGSVVAAANRNLTPKRWTAAWDILEIACKAGGADVAAGSARTMVNEYKRLEREGVNLPLPTEQVAPFIPILRESGLMK
tara:strand:+ start:24544 stop:25698 length:1155 start_codon:yes stop_codon:yes gene_type:complete